MIICAKTIITGDGETVLKDAAVMVDGSGKIQKAVSYTHLDVYKRQRQGRNDHRKYGWRSSSRCRCGN